MQHTKKEKKDCLNVNFNVNAQLLCSLTLSLMSCVRIPRRRCGCIWELLARWWEQLVERYGRWEAISSQLSPPYHGRQLALWSAPRLLRAEKENGAETKSSAPFLPLSAAKFAVIARVFYQTNACKINTMSGPFGKTQQIKKTRVASAHYRPCFWTIAAREVRRRDLVSGTPFLSFRN